MRNEKIRRAIANYEKTTGTNVDILNEPCTDNSIIGMIDGVLVYDYVRLIAEYQKETGCSKAEAADTIRNLYEDLEKYPYISRPVHIGLGIDTIIEEYYSVEPSDVKIQ